jgi:hypothetical protein
MSEQDAYDRGYRDYTKDRPCLVRKTRNGLRWSSRDESDDYAIEQLEPSPEVWADAYIKGYTQACKDDDGDIPMDRRERLRA